MRSTLYANERPRLAPRVLNPDGPNNGVIADDTVVAGATIFAAGEYHLFDPSGRWLTANPTRQAATRAVSQSGRTRS